jgi:hypothetical protein
MKLARFAPVLVGVATAASLSLAVPAFASTAGGYPTPSPSPSPSQSHRPHEPRAHCEFILLTGHALDHDQQARHDQGGGDQGSPYASLAPALASPLSADQVKGDHQRRVEVVSAEQVVQFCEQGERTWVQDVTGPFAQETESGRFPTPDMLPAPIEGYVSPSASAP